MRRTIAAALVALALLATGACSSSPDVVRVVEATEAVELIEAGDAFVIDVRTAAEFAAGHVAGARNIDVSSPTFEDEVESLDKGAGYLVYCQTGNRSGTAVDKMAGLGFEDLVDAGGIASLEAAGAEVVAPG